MKVIISNSIGEEIKYCGGLIYQEEPVFVIYTALSNIDEPFHITPDFLRGGIKKSSSLLNFNFEVIYTGRQYYGKLDSLPQSKIENVLKKRIEFLSPTDIFLPACNFDSSNNKVNHAIKNVYRDCGINIFEYGRVNPTYFYILSNEAIGYKQQALHSFGRLLPKQKPDIMEYYKTYRLYSEIPYSKKDQPKTRDNKDIPG